MNRSVNVLLAKADIPYEKLKEMDEINPTFRQTDLVLVIGANNVVNPLAREADPSIPIAGMPILDVDQARAVVSDEFGDQLDGTGVFSTLSHQADFAWLS